MNRHQFIQVLFLGGTVFLIGCGIYKNQTNTASGQSINANEQHEDRDGYWTCSMHPQIHQHEAGNCPICGMPLIKVKSEKAAASIQKKPISVSDEQIKNANITRYVVAKKDVSASLPVSGRMTSKNEVTFQVYETDLFFLSVGLNFQGYSVAHPETKLKGRIVRIDKIVDPASRTLRVTGELVGETKSEISDIAFHGEVIKNLRDVLAIPEESVLHTGTKDLVYVISENNELVPRSVRLGLKAGGEYQVLSGLTEKEVISAGANFLIDSESKIRGQ